MESKKKEYRDGEGEGNGEVPARSKHRAPGRARDEKSTALSLYGLHAGLADRASGRRNSSHQFFWLSHCFLFCALALVMCLSATLTEMCGADLLIGFFGAAYCHSSWLSSLSSKKLNAAKFEVLNKIERDYFKVRPFTEEYGFYKKAPRKDFSEVEQNACKLLGSVYASFFLTALLCSFLN